MNVSLTFQASLFCLHYYWLHFEFFSYVICFSSFVPSPLMKPFVLSSKYFCSICQRNNASYLSHSRAMWVLDNCKTLCSLPLLGLHGLVFSLWVASFWVGFSLLSVLSFLRWFYILFFLPPLDIGRGILFLLHPTSPRKCFLLCSRLFICSLNTLITFFVVSLAAPSLSGSLTLVVTSANNMFSILTSWASSLNWSSICSIQAFSGT